MTALEVRITQRKLSSSKLTNLGCLGGQKLVILRLTVVVVTPRDVCDRLNEATRGEMRLSRWIGHFEAPIFCFSNPSHKLWLGGNLQGRREEGEKVQSLFPSPTAVKLPKMSGKRFSPEFLYGSY